MDTLEIHEKLIQSSRMIADYAAQNPVEFGKICDDLANGKKLVSMRYSEKLFANVWEKNEVELGKYLRQFRKKEHIKLAAQDILQLEDTVETIQHLSDLAGSILDITYQFYFAQLSTKYGIPRSHSGEKQALTIFGMGKLGGGELNFSSDIDLIMCFPESGETDDSGELDSISNELFFHRIAQKMIRLLDLLDVNGFVYRVDMRLKPFGSVGNLCVTFKSMRRYYLEHGRNWERYALIKMRPVAGHIEQGEKLLSELESFIYQRHVDYTAVESIDEMKKKIVTKAREQALASNLKLGNGGIREIEFIVQAYQLLYGGRLLTLRTQSILQALGVLADKELLGAKMVEILRTNYLFLRRVENAIQYYLDQQTHDLPETEEAQQALISALSMDSWEMLTEKVDAVRYEVYQLFQRVFATNDTAQASVDIEKTNIEYWSEQLGVVKIQSSTLASLFAKFYKQMAAHDGDLGNKFLIRLNWVLPQIIKALENEDNPEKVGSHMLELLEAIADKSVYLSLLVENPQVLKKIMTLFMRSSWMTKFLCEHPLVIDELVHEGHEKTLPNKAEIKARLQHALEQTIDEQEKLQTIIDFKNSQIFRVASADLQNKIKTIHVSDQITWIAEAIMEEILVIARKDLVSKYGEPRFEMFEQSYQAEFGVIAYGKFGGFEMGYGSDMDLLFLHNSSGNNQMTDGDKPIENELFFIRLVQKITKLLTTLTPNGKLYEIDMRLRPSGNSGMPISSLTAFEDYQMQEAWTWEHQALVRARFVAGDDGIANGFKAVRQMILCQTRDPEKLKKDVLDMRERMRANAPAVKPGNFDLKQGIGGVTDVEFIVQYLLLLHSKDYRHLIRCSDNLRQLAALELFEVILSSQASELRLAYRQYRFLIHHQQLKGKKSVVNEKLVSEHVASVKKIWNEVFTVTENKLQ